MNQDSNYLANYRPNQLYTHPGGAGVYATIVGESETVFGEIEVTARSRLAVSAFYVQDKSDFSTFKITKLRYHKTYGWREDGHVLVNHFQLAQMKEFLEIISNLNLSDAQKTRLSLDNINVGALGALLSSSKGAELVRELAETPELREDIFALAAKRRVLAVFETMMAAKPAEAEWQAFFEANPWIFGHGLKYVFLDKASGTLTARTTGNSFDHRGKTVDALMRTRAEVSQFVLIEIKKNSTELLRSTAYRPGCWGVSDEVSNAVTQIQKTVFEFARNRFGSLLKDADGNDLGETVYTVEPRSYLVVGNLAELRGNTDKIACFELYRRNIHAPEILTFDELLYRARFIVDSLGKSDSSEIPGQ
jgi:hypothetical protein